MSGVLGVGVQLKQEELASKLGVSMSALREALKTLESEGLVTFYPNRGAVVSNLSAEEVREIFDIRLFLELGALELAFANLTETDLAEADAVLKEYDNEISIGKWSELNWRFHEILYQPAHRPKLLSMIQSLHNNVDRYMRLYLFTMKHLSKSQHEHRLLLNACAQKDLAAAKMVLRRHMEEAGKALTKFIDSRETE